VSWGARAESTVLCRAVYDIRLTDGVTEKYRFSCREDEPLLAGIRRVFCKEIPRGCSGGGCGVCKVVVKSGKINVFKPMSREHVTEEEIARKVVLACCTNPRSDLEIYLFGESERSEGEEGAGRGYCFDDRGSEHYKDRFDC
jgi:ferredoxin